MEQMKIYRIADGVYVRSRADLSTVAVRVDSSDIVEMEKARAYFMRCGLVA